MGRESLTKSHILATSLELHRVIGLTNRPENLELSHISNLVSSWHQQRIGLSQLQTPEKLRNYFLEEYCEWMVVDPNTQEGINEAVDVIIIGTRLNELCGKIKGVNTIMDQMAVSICMAGEIPVNAVQKKIEQNSLNYPVSLFEDSNLPDEEIKKRINYLKANRKKLGGNIPNLELSNLLANHYLNLNQLEQIYVAVGD